MISILLKVTITLVLALAGTRLARRSRAAVRHLVLAASFAVLLWLPITAVIVPTVRLEVPIAPASAAVLSVLDPVTFELPPTDDRTAFRETQSSGSATSDASGIEVMTVLLSLWLAGAMLCLARAIAGLRQARAMRRSAQPWAEGQALVDSLSADAGIRRHVALLIHESAGGPMTCGTLRPAILLPAGAPDWAASDLTRAVVHELEHVRRFDWLSLCIARTISAMYWFHPLVWIVNRQLALEAERACDDEVLRRSEPVEYADQLVDLAQRLSTLPQQPVLGMANHADLATRVLSVLDGRQRRGRAGAACIALAFAATLMLLGVISPLRLIATSPDHPSSQADTPQRFEVASIKPCKADALPPTSGAGGRGGGPGNAATSPGRAHWACVSVDQLIQTAHAGPDMRLMNSLTRQRPDDPQIVRNAPRWVYSEKFEVEAKAPGEATRATMIGPMLRALLEDRFALKTHRATEERSMYALTIAKSGVKIQRTAPGTCREFDPAQPSSPSPEPEDLPRCGALNMNWNGTNRLLVFTGFTIQAFTDGTLSGAIMDRFVVNRTGLDGRYDFRLEFAPDDNTPGTLAGTAWSRREGAAPPTGATIFAALEQLGLRLESIKAPAEYLVVDRIERPKPNEP